MQRDRTKYRHLSLEVDNQVLHPRSESAPPGSGSDAIRQERKDYLDRLTLLLEVLGEAQFAASGLEREAFIEESNRFGTMVLEEVCAQAQWLSPEKKA